MMTSEEEEEDYMSLAFIIDKNEEETKKKKKKRSTCNDNNNNKQERKKQRKIIQQEYMNKTLQQGLNKPIDESNKGFKLLEKFGFKKEEGGLGKLGTGIQEPIKAVPSSSMNLGIGKEKHLIEIQNKRKEKLIKNQKDIKLLENNYRKILKYGQECKQIKYDIYQCEKIIEQLDQRNDIIRHELWPLEVLQKEDNEDDVVEYEEENEPDDYSHLLSKLDARIEVSA